LLPEFIIHFNIVIFFIRLTALPVTMLSDLPFSQLADALSSNHKTVTDNADRCTMNGWVIRVL
jgi:hypothetical protein